MTPSDPTHPADVAAAIEATGGTSVTLAGVETFGHPGTAEAGEFDLAEVGGEQVPAVTLSAGVLPDGHPVAGEPIRVEAQDFVVLDHRLRDEGALVTVAYGTWPYEVEVYRPETSGEGTRGQQQRDHGDPIQTVGAEVWTVGGDVEPEEWARVSRGEWSALLPPHADVEPGDALKVVGPSTPRVTRFDVLHVASRTERFKVPVELDESDEVF